MGEQPRKRLRPGRRGEEADESASTESAPLEKRPRATTRTSENHEPAPAQGARRANPLTAHPEGRAVSVTQARRGVISRARKATRGPHARRTRRCARRKCSSVAAGSVQHRQQQCTTIDRDDCDIHRHHRRATAPRERDAPPPGETTSRRCRANAAPPLAAPTRWRRRANATPSPPRRAGDATRRTARHHRPHAPDERPRARTAAGGPPTTTRHRRPGGGATRECAAPPPAEDRRRDDAAKRRSAAVCHYGDATPPPNAAARRGRRSGAARKRSSTAHRHKPQATVEPTTPAPRDRWCAANGRTRRQ